jgi:ribonuclease E
MKKEMLINVLQPEECRIAIVEDGVLEELYVERTSQETYVGNIYKGRIVNIEPSIQAAFVDFGIGRNGFLHVSDVEPAYYRHLEERRDNGRRGGRGRSRERVRPLEDEVPPLEAEEEPPLPEFEPADVEQPQEPIDEAPEGYPALEPLEEHHDAPHEESHGQEPHDEHESSHDEPPPDRPRYMGSAERHTEEGETGGEHFEDDIFAPHPDLGGPAKEPSPEPMAEYPEAASHAEMAPESHAEVVSEAMETEESFLEPEPEEDVRRPREREEREPRRRRGGPRDQQRRGGGRGGNRRQFGGRGMGRPKPLIQDIFKRGQEVLVQVIKEGIGTKGPTLSTYISIAGRYLVLMPGLNRIGVSRKIADDEQRRRLREIFHELRPPRGLGFIIRTAGIDKTKKELQRDLAYLSRLWQVVVRRIRKMKAPAEIYQESDMITRTIRDTFTSDIDTIWVDEPAAFEHAQEFLQIVMPRYAARIKHYTDSEPLFYKYSIEDEISRIQQRHVPLPNGGSIVIDQTEALVAIDVNSGNFRADNNAEETAFRMNILAAKEIARQLRLRDLGGVIVNDFIDMREDRHRRDVERALRDAVRRDRARTKILKISQFGLIEMTRQRIRPSLKRSVYQDCPHCHGTSQVKTCESMSIDVMRMLQLAAHRQNVHRIHARVHEDVANYLLNRKRREITRLEESGELQITITGAQGVSPELLEFVCYDQNNNEVKFLPYDENRQRRR